MLPGFFINRPIFAWVIALAILLTGALSLGNLPVSQYPEVAPPALAISTNYPGASAQVIEDTVTALIEQEMNGLENLLYMESSSDSTGAMNITLTFVTGTNLNLASVEAQNRVKRVEARLPEDVRRQGITINKSRRNFLMFVAINSPDQTLDAVALGSYTTSHILENIRRVKGVGEAQFFGTEYALRVWLDPLKLASFGISPAEALRIMRSQNAQIATGELGQTPSLPGQQISATVVTRGRLANAEEFGNIILRGGTTGAAVRLKDVGVVELGALDYTTRARLNGKPTAAMGLKLAPGENALETAHAVRKRMGELAESFPKGIGWDVPYDTSRFIDISIREVLKTLIEAFILVFFVMWLFLGSLRAAIIPTIVVPVSLVGTLVGLYFLGFSINVLTLFAMVLAIGIVVDDAIVVVENVERIMTNEGLDPVAATRKAMKQIFGAIVGITVVLSAVFVPMAFFAGSVGAIYKQFAVTLVITMAFSALLAITLTPALCATILKHTPLDASKPRRGFFAAFNRLFSKTSHGYFVAAQGVVKRPIRFLAVYLAIGVATVTLFTKLPGGFLPDEDQGYFISIIQLPPGATQERTLAVLSQVEQHYLSLPEVEKVVGVAGFSFFGRGQDAAIAFVRLKDWDIRTTPDSHALQVVQRANMAMFRIKQSMVFALNPPPIPELAAVGGFDFRLQDRSGQGRDKLLDARNLVLGLASKNPVLAGVRPEGREPGTQLLLDIDRLKAASLGIEIGELNETLSIALGSAYVNDFIRDGRILRVLMQVDAASRATPEGLLALRVRSTRGSLVPLSEIATPQWIVGSPKLDRYNGAPSMKIAGNPSPGHSTGEAMSAMEDIAKQLPPGFGFDWSGTSYEERLSGAQVPMLFGLSILVVFMCLAALYESWTIPLAVLLVVPLGLFGAVLAVTFRELPNDVYFKVGLVAIIGLAAKNSILIIEFARQLEAEGRTVLDAVLEACRLRFRPIIMTSLAFIFGVSPLAFSTGAGAASRHAIGTGVMGGMIAATVFAVFLVPVLYVAVRKIFPGKVTANDHEKIT